MPVINDLPMDKECLFSGLPMGTCSHCRGDDDLLINEDDSDYEVTAVFDSQYHGTCTINRNHNIRRGEKVGFVQHADNPMLTVRGVACKNCVAELPRARRR